MKPGLNAKGTHEHGLYEGPVKSLTPLASWSVSNVRGMDVLWLRLWAEARSRDVWEKDWGTATAAVTIPLRCRAVTEANGMHARYWDIVLEEIHHCLLSVNLPVTGFTKI